MSSFDYLREFRNMPWIKRGMQVDVGGKRGTVIGGGNGGCVRIRLDGEKRPNLYHPQWHTTYYDQKGRVIASYTIG